MSPTRSDSIAYTLFDRVGCPRTVEKGNVLLPRNTHNHPQAILPSGIQEPDWRHRIGPNCVNSVYAHGAEIALNDFRIVVQATVFIRVEGTVGDTSDVELLLSVEKKLTCYARPFVREPFLTYVARLLQKSFLCCACHAVC